MNNTLTKLREIEKALESAKTRLGQYIAEENFIRLDVPYSEICKSLNIIAELIAHEENGAWIKGEPNDFKEYWCWNGEKVFIGQMRELGGYVLTYLDGTCALCEDECYKVYPVLYHQPIVHSPAPPAPPKDTTNTQKDGL